MVLPLFIYPHKNTPNPFPRAPSMCDIQSDNSASSCESFHHTLLLQLLKDAPRKRWVLFSFMGGEKPKSSEVRKVSDRTTRSRHSCVKFQTFYFSHKMQSWEVDSSSPVATLLRLKSVFILCNSVYVILVILCHSHPFYLRSFCLHLFLSLLCPKSWLIRRRWVMRWRCREFHSDRWWLYRI